MRILLTGGGTAGHLSPLIAVVRELKKIGKEKGVSDIEFIYIGPDHFSNEMLKNEGIEIKKILTGKLRRYFALETFLDVVKLPIGFLQALWYLFIYMPEATFGKGGYGSVPAVLISWLYRIPILIHESDATPGLANRFLSRFAKRIAVSFPSTLKSFPSQKTALVGNPIRQEITQGTKEKAKNIFNLVGKQPLILIIGGSQGAQAINELILLDIVSLTEKYELIWQTGEKNYDETVVIIKKTVGLIPENCHILPFLNEEQMANALAAADLVVSRAGASAIFEIAACGKPSIIIPLPGSASDHQRENAREFAQSGATVLLEQENLTPHLFLNEIDRLFSDQELLYKMTTCAKLFAKPEAARKIAEELINLAPY